MYRPERLRELRETVTDLAEMSLIARGLGRSYGDTAVNGGAGVIDCTRLNRMRDFNPRTGVLTCEGGVSFAEILEAFVPRGWFLPVTPGTKFVTVAGAIANDVHGKNHHRDGTFGQYVREIELLLPSGGVLRCSPERDADVFWATVGGIGLTGIILSATFELMRIDTAWVRVDSVQARNIDEALALFAESDIRYKYSVAWVDCLAKGASLGRSVLMRGNHAGTDELPQGVREPLALPRKRQKTVPLDFPAFVLNPLSVRAFNETFYRTHPTRAGRIVDYDSYFYPLDAIHHWNRMYGRHGFTQYQVSLPPGEAKALVRLLERLSQSGRASFLAVLKCFGPGNAGLLSYPSEGYTLTLDIPIRSGLEAFLHECDRLLLDHGGKLYLAKDVMMRPETFAAMYPRADAFREIKARLDPRQRLSSSMARRLGIVDAAVGRRNGR